MLGAIYGDVAGSVYEFDNIKTKDFEMFTAKNFFTDDTVMTLAVAAALLEHLNALNEIESLKKTLIDKMHLLGNEYPDAGYGGRFEKWLFNRNTEPYNSFGNGSAMRVSPVAWYGKTIDEVETLAAATAEVTHNHPEGVKGAVVTAGAAFLARTGHTKKEIKEYIEKYYDIGFTVDEIRPVYEFNETCQKSVPEALVCFLESESFEDAVRNCISIGGDCDTTAAICGAVAQGFYGMTDEQMNNATSYLDDRLLSIAMDFYNKYMS